MPRGISEERKLVHYVGLGLAALGLLLFLSVFVSAALHFGDFSNFEERGRSMAFRAVSGFILMIAGGVTAVIGARGLAGSGVVLDPEKAREDLEPYARMAGGMVGDALEEARVDLGTREPERVIMVRCHACGKLNAEDAKFCQECGKAMA